MSATKKNWITVTESRYPWERDALDFVHDRWPDHEPWKLSFDDFSPGSRSVKLLSS